MKVVAFNGSPRVGGNSEIILMEALRGVETSRNEIVRFDAGRMDISPCLSCGKCMKTGICVLKDDMKVVYDAIKSCDRMIISTPVFFMGLPSQFKRIIDRCQCLWSEKYLLQRPIIPSGKENGRKGLVIVVCGMKQSTGIKCVMATINAFFKTVNISLQKCLSFPGVDEKGAIKRHPDALRQAYFSGAELVRIEKNGNSGENL